MIGAAVNVIDFQPRDQTVVLYQQAAFGVIARGTAPLSYEWRKDGVPIPGATNDQLVFAHSQFSDAGRYSVIVSNAEGSATSAEARLSVNSPKGGDLDYSFAWGGSIYGHGLSGSDAYVTSVVVQSDAKVLIGGRFTRVNGVNRTNIARLNADGTLDSDFQIGLSGFADYVTSVAVQSDAKVLIGGGYTNIARLNADGTLDSDFQVGLSGTEPYLGDVNSVAIQSDGKVLIGGWFTRVNGVGRTNIARLNADGTLDSSFQTEASGDYASVSSVALQSDGKVLIGGRFTRVNGAPAAGVARLHADGSLDTDFHNELSEPTTGVNSIAVQSDGKVLIGRSFGPVYLPNPNVLRRLNADGTLDGSFRSSLKGESDGVHRFVSSIVIQSDGKILIGGGFTIVNGESRYSFARLNADGTLDTGFLSGLPGTDGNVYSIAAQSDGKVVIGGSFNRVNGVRAVGIARLWGSADIPPRIQSITRSDINVTLAWDALPNRIYRAQFKDAAAAATWTDLPGDVSGASNGIANKTDATLGNPSQRFYRVLLLP
jgi:uncharacterized delta-60 repeat protein